MKKLCTMALAATLAASALAPQTAQAADFREHRSVWVTAYLGDWPSGPIKKNNAEIHKRYLRTHLDKLKSSGINVIYYHVRSHCDAYYNSKYEPWSEHVSGTRGVAPAFDPLEVLLEEAHERGIEVYAWFNPYRYCGVYGNGQSELDYEYTHPEWLIVQSGKETILNPGLEEVKQRICDVITDVIEKYDVDGIIFDDYFYSNPTPMDLDADLYNAAKAVDPSVGTQIQWRVANVNSMVERVHNTVKTLRPWMPFGISPAGITSPAHITSEYGLPSISGEWQYNAIASDPIYWYKHHTIDFMAPQIYWPKRFDEVQTWWNRAARMYGRHLYSAVTLSEARTYGSEFSRELEFSRDLLSPNENGVSYFRLDNYINTVFRYNGVGVDFYEFMGEHAQSMPALMPVRPWNNVYSPAYVTNLRREDGKLVWDKVEGVRYTVYAFKDGEELRPHNSNLQQVRYTNDYTIPADMAGCTFGVAVYDRYGNEYSMTTEGATPGKAVIPVLTYPENGAKAADLFDFEWEETGCDNILEVAADPEFKDVLVFSSCAGKSMSSYAVSGLEEGKTYYWRLHTSGVNAPAGVSETRSFVASRVEITGPGADDQPLTPTITWTPAFEGSTYTVELSHTADFKNVLFTAQTDDTSLRIGADACLYTGYLYYCRVTASRDGRTSSAEPRSFWTADAVPAMPRYVTPATDGATLHANEAIEVERPEGASSMVVQVCAQPTFTGGIYKCTLRTGETKTALASAMKMLGKKLVSGQTYYVRAYSRYFTRANQTAETNGEYALTTFVYSDTEGVSDIVADGSGVAISPDGILSMEATGNDVKVYSADGSLVHAVAAAPSLVDLSSLPAGLYIVSVSGVTPATIKWVK